MREPQADASDVDGFVAAIHHRYGYDLRGYAAASLRRRVHAALRKSGLGTIGELTEKSLAEPEFFGDVLDSLTVQVSELFRDPGLFRALRDRVAPVLRTYARLNVWVSGCATGEEAYSIAILLIEEGLYDRCQIYATDLNARTLARAADGLFPAAASAALAANHAASGGNADVSRYYTLGYGRIAVQQVVRRNISFFQHDLIGDHVFAEMDLVLCRNVLIYFGRALKDKVIHKLADSLRPGGFLCLGASEQLPREHRGLFADFAPEQRIYRREPSR